MSLLRLPDELLLIILQFVFPVGIVDAASTCRRLHQLASPLLEKHHRYRRKYGFIKFNEECDDESDDKEPDYEDSDYEDFDLEDSDYEDFDLENPDYRNPDFEYPDYEEPDYENPGYEYADYEEPKYETSKYDHPLEVLHLVLEDPDIAFYIRRLDYFPPNDKWNPRPKELSEMPNVEKILKLSEAESESGRRRRKLLESELARIGYLKEQNVERALTGDPDFSLSLLLLLLPQLRKLTTIGSVETHEILVNLLQHIESCNEHTSVLEHLETIKVWYNDDYTYEAATEIEGFSLDPPEEVRRLIAERQRDGGELPFGITSFETFKNYL